VSLYLLSFVGNGTTVLGYSPQGLLITAAAAATTATTASAHQGIFLIDF
jgi:hypothetical protein